MSDAIEKAPLSAYMPESLIALLTPGTRFTSPDGREMVVVPVEPTQEMLRCHLAQEWPALFGKELRSPLDGPKGRAETEARIEMAQRRWTAMIAAASEPDAP
jgi:hypothetical protein